MERDKITFVIAVILAFAGASVVPMVFYVQIQTILGNQDQRVDDANVIRDQTVQNLSTVIKQVVAKPIESNLTAQTAAIKNIELILENQYEILEEISNITKEVNNITLDSTGRIN